MLVHGLLANMTDNWQTMSPLLANNGYCVFAFTYGNSGTAPLDEFGGLAPMEQSAAQLSSFVDQVLAATGAHKVDIVGHSEGATMPDYYIEYLGGAAKVARYVGISGVKHGTTLHGVGTFVAAFEGLFPGAPDPTAGTCASCSEFLVGSAYMHDDRGAGAGAGRDLHEHLHPLRRARQPVHEQLPHRTQRHEHHAAGPLPRSTSATTSRSCRARSPVATC